MVCFVLFVCLFVCLGVCLFVCLFCFCFVLFCFCLLSSLTTLFTPLFLNISETKDVITFKNGAECVYEAIF